jgi:hypothetical protein
MSELVHYVFIGKVDSLIKIGDYSKFTILENIKNQVNKIFSDYCRTNKEINKNNIEQRKNGNYYYKISSKNIFYLIIAGKSIEENTIFNLIDKIEIEQIPFMVDEQTYHLKHYSQIKLEKIINDFNKEIKTINCSSQNNFDEKRNLNQIIINENNYQLYMTGYQNLLKSKIKYRRISFIIKIIVIILLILFLVIVIFISI